MVKEIMVPRIPNGQRKDIAVSIKMMHVQNDIHTKVLVKWQV